MRFKLAELVRRSKRPRRKEIVLRPVVLPSTLASDLFASAYRPVIAAWSEALPRILAEYERSLGEMTQDSPADVGEVLTATENDMFALTLTIRARLEGWAENVARAHARKWAASVLSGTGIDISAMIGPADARMTVGAAIERNVSLVKSVNEQARTRIGEAVFRGLTQRKPAREVAAELRGAVDMGRRRSLNIASDQLVKISSELQDERRRQAGLTTWEWMSSHKTNYRPEHKARDGKRYDDDATSGPHKPPEDRPGSLPFCGCTSRAVLDLTGEF